MKSGIIYLLGACGELAAEHTCASEDVRFELAFLLFVLLAFLAFLVFENFRYFVPSPLLLFLLFLFLFLLFLLLSPIAPPLPRPPPLPSFHPARAEALRDASVRYGMSHIARRLSQQPRARV
jgi:hypothetical protein